VSSDPIEQSEQLLSKLRGLGEWDEDSELHIILTSELSLPQASLSDDTEATCLLRDWVKGRLSLEAPNMVALNSIDASIQGILRRDVLEFYLTHTNKTFDESPSSWGALGPLAVELNGGRVVLVDGNHRWATARIRGDDSFKAQVLRRQVE
jgi:hypothetical protein